MSKLQSSKIFKILPITYMKIPGVTSSIALVDICEKVVSFRSEKNTKMCLFFSVT